MRLWSFADNGGNDDYGDAANDDDDGVMIHMMKIVMMTHDR